MHNSTTRAGGPRSAARGRRRTLSRESIVSDKPTFMPLSEATGIPGYSGWISPVA